MNNWVIFSSPRRVAVPCLPSWGQSEEANKEKGRRERQGGEGWGDGGEEELTEKDEEEKRGLRRWLIHTFDFYDGLWWFSCFCARSYLSSSAWPVTHCLQPTPRRHEGLSHVGLVLLCMVYFWQSSLTTAVCGVHVQRRNLRMTGETVMQYVSICSDSRLFYSISFLSFLLFLYMVWSNSFTYAATFSVYEEIIFWIYVYMLFSGA